MIMKTIKYFAAFVCAALVMGACTETDGLSDQNAGKEKPVVEITQKVATDLDLQFNLKVTDNANQFGYVLLAGHGNTVPTPVSILANEVSGALAAETFWYEENDEDTYVKSVTIDCSEFKTPYEKYQVFAVAITADGLAGDVVSLDVTMNDKTAPAPVSFNPDANTVEVEWNEEVVLGTGKAYVSVLAFGAMAYAVQNQEIAAENITVEGNILTIVCPEAPAGAGYVVSIDAGIVTDLSGNPSPEIKSAYSGGKYQNIGWTTPNVEIPITAASFVEPAEDVDWTAEGANLVFKLPTQVMDAGLTNPIKVVYDESEGVSYLNAEYTLAEDAQTVTVFLPRTPTGYFDVIIAEGAFFDVWDNQTTGFEPSEYRYSNFMDASVVGGNMTISYIYPDNEGKAETSAMNAKLNVMDRNTVILQADWFEAFGGWRNPMLYGTVDYDTHTITYDGTFYSDGSLYKSAFGEYFYYYDQAKTMMLKFLGGGEDGMGNVTMKFDENGYVTSMSSCAYVVVSATDGSMLGIYGMTTDDSKVTYSTAAQTTNAVRVVKNAELCIDEAKLTIVK